MARVHRGFCRTTVALCVLASAAGCAHVPKEVVQLSYGIGEDTRALEVSYKRLIHAHFEGLRRDRLRYLEEEWVPAYLSEWITDGRLRDIAGGVVVWSPEARDFGSPQRGHEERGLLASVNFWAQAAIDEIETKRDSLLAPLDTDESTLTGWVDEAFSRVFRANATITAHLSSLGKVQEVQDETLKALHLKELRDKIDTALIATSDKSAAALEAVRKADGLVEDARSKLRSGKH